MFWGAAIQISLGLFVLRTSVGTEIFGAMGEFVAEFIDCVIPGVELVFGKNYMDHFFAFKVRTYI